MCEFELIDVRRNWRTSLFEMSYSDTSEHRFVCLIFGTQLKIPLIGRATRLILRQLQV